ncbi:nonhistone chromosomal [Fusarium acutatum]|uniref:Nonhistone chromosomal n=1 Tax=Fusarium acutatum TaxID=78861 RepID=A0A8H4NLX6_9HYPO|nr:nonhistone chromosomal [Fusarium acutatum]
MARPKKQPVEKQQQQQQPAPVPIPPQHIQQYPQHPQPIAAVPQPAMPMPMPPPVGVPQPQAVMPQRVVEADSFLRVRDSSAESFMASGKTRHLERSPYEGHNQTIWGDSLPYQSTLLHTALCLYKSGTRSDLVIDKSMSSQSLESYGHRVLVSTQAPHPLTLDLSSLSLLVLENHKRRITNITLQAVGRLTTILELLRSFTADYVRQTNLLLGEPTAEGSQDNLLANFEHAAQQLIMPVPELAPPVEEKKERKKRTIDPNAPKRPLTPYFLYMQHARSIIANDLGSEAPKGAVQEEGQRRWAHMGPQEKQGWNNAYQYNLRLYNARVHSYKHGNPLAKNMTDEEALKYAEDFNVPMSEIKDAAQNEAPADDQDAIAEQLQAVAAAPAIDEPEQAETPAKTPKKATGGRKRKTATPAAAAEEAKPAPASPDKKRRRTSTKAAAAEPQEEPKKSGRKKTKSS